MRVAKCSERLGDLHNYELSPRFNSIYDCQKYIDEKLKIINWLLGKAFDMIIYGNQWEKGKKLYQISFSGSMIRCYNLKQKRFADSLDF